MKSHVRLSAQRFSLVLPCELVGEDRVAPSDGTNGRDRVRILIAGKEYWVERRDLCTEDGELIAWEPYDLELMSYDLELRLAEVGGRAHQ